MEKSRVFVTMTMFLLSVFIFGCFVLVQAETKMDDKEMAEMHQKIKALKKKKITEALGLNKESSEKLFSVIDKYDDKRHELMRGMRVDIKNLRKAVDDKKDNMTRSLVDKIVHNQKELLSLKLSEVDELNELRSMFTTEQQAKYILFSVDFNKTIKKIMAEKRRNRSKDGKED
ncbi:MAG: hypothetical protein HQK88_09125 [Nitrospirae bacterium]|nr:hypothetical protein [Nitrospirota bacterium]MBF0535658.1 hypothetical protein [Nitrospirota bacterium]MBF0616964.1 hypothetical protein [Nitrospirota bacterium]